jgi:hypothetical protein
VTEGTNPRLASEGECPGVRSDGPVPHSWQGVGLPVLSPAKAAFDPGLVVAQICPTCGCSRLAVFPFTATPGRGLGLSGLRIKGLA